MTGMFLLLIVSYIFFICFVFHISYNARELAKAKLYYNLMIMQWREFLSSIYVNFIINNDRLPYFHEFKAAKIGAVDYAEL